jgi:uncharacterized protein YjbK
MEVELQFVYDGDAPLVVPIRLCDLGLHSSRTRSLLDTYYDTETLALRRSGCSLRVRQAENVVRPVLTVKGPSRKRSQTKQRYELEVEVEQLPPEIEDMASLLDELKLMSEVRRLSGLKNGAALVPIGSLRNRRSEHRYRHGLHRLHLTWDELEYPTGPPELRLEVEAASPHAERLLEQAADELRALLGDTLRAPRRGKTRELCSRLYPDLS